MVLAPTREIAMQGVQVASQVGCQLPHLKLASFIGGLPVAEDKAKAQHCHLAVGTPGRLRQVNLFCFLTILLSGAPHSSESKKVSPVPLHCRYLRGSAW